MGFFLPRLLSSSSIPFLLPCAGQCPKNNPFLSLREAAKRVLKIALGQGGKEIKGEGVLGPLPTKPTPPKGNLTSMVEVVGFLLPRRCRSSSAASRRSLLRPCGRARVGFKSHFLIKILEVVGFEPTSLGRCWNGFYMLSVFFGSRPKRRQRAGYSSRHPLQLLPDVPRQNIEPALMVSPLEPCGRRPQRRRSN